MTDVVVRLAGLSDLDALAEIYDAEVADSIATFDTEPQGVGRWTDRVGGAYPVLVATEGDRVVGYTHASAYRPRPAYGRSCETSVYVAASSRGRGIARVLYTALLARLDDAGIHRSVAVIALPNAASEALHRALGFRRVGVLTEVGYKFDRWVDVALYERPGPVG